MSLVVDTSVWSLALQRDAPRDGKEITLLYRALNEGLGLTFQDARQHTKFKTSLNATLFAQNERDFRSNNKSKSNLAGYANRDNLSSYP